MVEQITVVEAVHELLLTVKPAYYQLQVVTPPAIVFWYRPDRDQSVMVAVASFRQQELVCFVPWDETYLLIPLEDPNMDDAVWRAVERIRMAKGLV
jgi:hypothetical protein